MMRFKFYAACLLLLISGACAAGQSAQAPTPAPPPDSSSPPNNSSPPTAAAQAAIDPTADQILRQACDFLAQSPAFAVHAEIWKDQVLPSGHKIQVTRSIDLDLRRPDRLHVDARAHQKGRSIWYDGKTLTVLDRQTNLYGTADAPGTIDQTIDLAAETYGVTVPLEDLAVSDPYASFTKNVTAGGYFGDELVLGVPCRHIGYSTDKIDWQLWVADGPQPLPQKMVITYKTEDQSPQYTAIFSKWNLTERAADLAFQFIPPPGSAKIPLVKQAAGGTQP
jgi:hypothetical protein